jgi:hypothetical protein
MAGADIDNLLEEGALAVAFYTKCLFYSNSPHKTGPPENVESISNLTFPTFTYPSFLEEIESLKERQPDLVIDNPAAKKIAHFFYWQSSQNINDIYSAANEKVFARLKDVTIQYKAKLAAIETADIKIADRNLIYITSSRAEALQRSKTLTDKINQHFTPGQISPFSREGARVFSNEWRVIREIGSVLMTEIDFLSRRVDDFQNLLNANEAQNSTNESLKKADEAIRLANITLVDTKTALGVSQDSLAAARKSIGWAIAAIVFGVFISLFGTFCSYEIYTWQKRDNSDGATNATITSAATSTSKQLEVIKGSLETSKESDPKAIEAIASKLDKLNANCEGILELLRNFSKQPPQSATVDVPSLAELLKTINASLIKIQTQIDNRSAKGPKDRTSIAAECDKLSDLLEDLKKIVEGQNREDNRKTFINIEHK